MHSKTLRYFRQRLRELRTECASHRASGHESPYEVREGGRSWESYYRRRWQHDKVARSTHGVNCTGSCSFDVFVKDGLIVWEAQKTDYPTPHPDFPDYEPRGCPRGVSASWYVYSPLRVKHPLIRSTLLDMWRDIRKQQPDPVLAWQTLQADATARTRYQQARGHGGFVRCTWEEALELVAASLVTTIKDRGPDRIFGFTPLPAMSMVSFASGARFLSLLGASMVSFYDWYCDLPPASPQMWGEQTDVAESADWYNAGYIIAWGSNLPQTRTPDAHFYVEARYRGTRIAAVSPDYADYTKFADHWLPVRAGTDGALGLAMSRLVLDEYFLQRRVPYFEDYCRRFTDLPFLMLLDETTEGLTPGRFLRATDVGLAGNNPEWKGLVFDQTRQQPAVPMGCIGSRYGEEGTWNLAMHDALTHEPLDPLLSLGDLDTEKAARLNIAHQQVVFPVFSSGAPAGVNHAVPCFPLTITDGQGTRTVQVTTVFDALLGSLGLTRTAEPAHTAAPDGIDIPGSPAWQEPLTGVNRDLMIRVAREFADNAVQTRGKSMIIMGAGINHWYNNDITYRAILLLTTLCGCQGVSGGGWAHYVGQEKVRPLAGWTTLTVGSDWLGPPRLHNGTSFYYFATDAWRYELLNTRRMRPAFTLPDMPAHPADCNAVAARLGWLPFYPQFAENPLTVCDEAAKAVEKAGASASDDAASNQALIDHVVERLHKGDLKLAVDDPDNLANVPRVMFFWRANPLGSNVKGHEYFLRHMLGTTNAVLAEPRDPQPETFRVEPLHLTDGLPDDGGKLDLMVTAEIRMSTTCLYSDIVLPAAHWYEYDDLSTTDLHPFVHPFTAAVDPAWEARTNWDMFGALADAFTPLATEHLGTRRDMVATALGHDTPGEIAQPYGEVRDWTRGETEPVPGKTLFNLHVVERPYPAMAAMYRALGPRVTRENGVGAKGVAWSCAPEYDLLKARLGVVETAGPTQGMPRLATARDACETILTLSPETNGNVGVRSWAGLERQTGLVLNDLSRPIQDVHLTFEDITARPRKGFTSPCWSGIEAHGRTYAPYELNVQRLVPFHTLTGRQHVYLDHDWMRALGESLPTYRPPLELADLGEVSGGLVPRASHDLVLGFLSPHSKWSIHSSYSDNLLMRLLSRGGGEVWLNHIDAAKAGIGDNDWVECYNANGVFMGRAVLTHRMPEGKTFIHHAQERTVNVPLAPLTGQRGGSHNSLTRTLVKPSQMIGGYAQLSYAFNYYGPTGCQRDECVVIRKSASRSGEVAF